MERRAFSTSCTTAKVPQSQLTRIEACSLLIGDHTAKVCTGVLAPKVKKAFEQFLPPQQCGNTRGGGTNRGHHVVSTFVRYARKQRIPSAILFMPLTSWFAKSCSESAKHTAISTRSRESWSGHGCCIPSCPHRRFQWWFVTSTQSRCTRV